MKYVIGIDYGTLSARAILMEAESGRELAESVFEYPHAVMDRELPCGTPLPSEFALQHPSDYVEALKHTVRGVTKGIDVGDVVGLGIDFTACTLIAMDSEGTPLCLKPEFSSEPHAYVKLWKHHAAQSEADEINALASARGESWLPLYGGKISAEWALPKILETLRKAPFVFDATYRFIDAGDWLSLLLTGKETHARSFAGYKWLYVTDSGYPSNDFMKALDPRLDGIVGSRLSPDVAAVDEKTAGLLCKQGAQLTGLLEGTPVAMPIIDAHAAMPAMNITHDGELILILGTSGCYILNSKEEQCIEGTGGYVKSGIFSGICTYEAGQSSVGDSFDWFVKRCVPEGYHAEARQRGIGIHKLLREKAQRLSPGESGLLALDWWGGNRSILIDHSLKGMILGLDLSTRPEEIYRAIIEATAYGTRVILEHYEQHGVQIHRICAAGGIAKKDGLMMQIYADVLKREISIGDSTQAGARGSAMRAAVSAGVWEDMTTVAEALARPDVGLYRPNSESSAVYDELYAEYKRLHDYFGRGENTVMTKLGKYKK